MFTELRKYSIAENYSILHFRKIVHNFENMEMGFYGLLKWYLSDKYFKLKYFLLLIFNVMYILKVEFTYIYKIFLNILNSKSFRFLIINCLAFWLISPDLKDLTLSEWWTSQTILNKKSSRFLHKEESSTKLIVPQEKLNSLGRTL